MTGWVRLKAFLLGNHGWKQIVVKNTVWTSVAESVVRLLKLALIFLVVRYFGPTEYGKFAFAFSFAAMFGIVFDSGLVLAATREFSVDRKNEQMLPDILLMRLALGLVGMVGITIGSLWMTSDTTIRSMMVILGASLFLGELLNLGYALIRARQKMEYECLVRVAQAVFLLVMVAALVWIQGTVVHLSWAYLGATVLTLVAVAIPTRRRLRELRFEIRWEVWKRLLRVGFPLALAGGMGAVYMNIDSVMLGYWGHITETGWYNAASKLNGIALVPMSLLMLVTFPAFTAMSHNVDDGFRRRWDTWATAMIGLGAMFACVILASADGIVELAFGKDYQPAALALRILILTAVLMYLYTPAYQALIMFNRQMRLFWCLALGAVVNVLLNIVLIPRFSLYGAAWATVVTHLIILVQLFRDAARYTPIQPVTQALLGSVAVALVAGVATYSILRTLSPGVWLAVPLGIIIFLGCFAGSAKVKQALGARRRPSVVQEA
ncbi:flippase [Nitrospira sp. Kam-Ns4a]